MNRTRVKPAAPRITAKIAAMLGAAFGPFLLPDAAQAQSARDAAAESAGAPRVENWFVFRRNTDDSGQLQYWPRLYVPFELPRGWTFTQRLDLPIAYTDRVGPQNPAGAWTRGINDWFAEEIFAPPELASGIGLIGSVRLVFPTGGLGPFGSGQYQVAPAIGMRHAVPGRAISFSPLARYFISVHATDDAAPRVRTLDLFPTATFGLAEGWSLSLYSENPLVYSAVSHKWFVPVDVLLLKRLSRTIDFTIGGAYGLLKDAPQYQYIVNASVSVYFH